MTLKLGGYICDNCRKIISYSYDPIKIIYKQKGKKGQLLTFCSAECENKIKPLKK